MFNQVLDPFGNLFATWLVALVPVALLLFLLAVLRMSAWLATKSARSSPLSHMYSAGIADS